MGFKFSMPSGLPSGIPKINIPDMSGAKQKAIDTITGIVPGIENEIKGTMGAVSTIKDLSNGGIKSIGNMSIPDVSTGDIPNIESLANIDTSIPSIDSLSNIDASIPDVDQYIPKF